MTESPLGPNSIHQPTVEQLSSCSYQKREDKSVKTLAVKNMLYEVA